MTGKVIQLPPDLLCPDMNESLPSCLVANSCFWLLNFDLDGVQYAALMSFASRLPA